MATSFAVDPWSYVHPALQTERNVFYMDDYWTRITHYKNTIRMPGGNPWVLGDHGGGWIFFDKTTNAEGAGAFKLLVSYLLDGANYPTTAPAFDFFSIETRLMAHQGISGPPLNTIYEPTLGGLHPGTGPRSLPAYGRTCIEDAQRAIQHVKRNADHYGVNANKGNVFGISAGSLAVGGAALSNTAPFSPITNSTSMWDAYHASTVRSWINWIGPINLSTAELQAVHTGPLLGIIDADVARQKVDTDAVLMIPGTSNPSPRCATLSPALLVDNIGDNRSLRIFSWYDADIAGAIPYADPHDSGQFAKLAAKCAAKGMFHTGGTPSLSVDFGSDQQLFWESSLAPIYTFLVDSVA